MNFTNENEFFQHMKERFRQFDEDARLLREGKGHLDHPEDLVILSDVAGANQAISSILATAKNPNER